MKDNARLNYSDIGTMVGLSRVAVKNRMDAMEKKGIIGGYAPNNETLGSHVCYLYNHTEGIRRLEYHVTMETYMDVDGGVEYVRYQESEHLEREQQQ